MKHFIKKIIASLCVCSMLALSFTACGGNSEAGGSTSQTTDASGNTDGADTDSSTAAVNKYPDAPKVEINNTYTQDMSVIERSLLNTGNTERMQNFMNKAASSDSVTVAYIGGSITYGYTVGATECYAYKFQTWITNTFQTEVNYVNAGISGTPSVLGNLRVERDVLSQDPDLVVIEFAVNDGFDDEYKNSYESLINKILEYNDDVAVLLLFCITSEGHTCQEWMSEIGYYYDLPMVSVVDSMNEEVEAGNISFSDYSKDGSHPTPTGHTWITEYLEYCLTTIYNMDFESEHYTLPEKAYYKNYYKNMTMYTNQTLSLDELGSWSFGDSISDFADGWTYNPGEDNEPLTFTCDSRGMIILYHEMPETDTTYGAVDIYVDGEYTQSIYACDSSGWNNPTYNIVFEQVSSAEHVIEIKAKEGYEDLKFEVLAIAYMQ